MDLSPDEELAWVPRELWRGAEPSLDVALHFSRPTQLGWGGWGFQGLRLGHLGGWGFGGLGVWGFGSRDRFASKQGTPSK